MQMELLERIVCDMAFNIAMQISIASKDADADAKFETKSNGALLLLLRRQTSADDKCHHNLVTSLTLAPF
jgi:hypothetical protein